MDKIIDVAKRSNAQVSYREQVNSMPIVEAMQSFGEIWSWVQGDIN